MNAPRRAPAFEPLGGGRVALLCLRLAGVFLLEEKLRLLLLALACALLGVAIAHAALGKALALGLVMVLLCCDYRGYTAASTGELSPARRARQR